MRAAVRLEVHAAATALGLGDPVASKGSSARAAVVDEDSPPDDPTTALLKDKRFWTLDALKRAARGK